MKKEIYSAELELYNANSRGTNTGDCVKRAMSFAFDVPYNQMSKLLNAKMKELRYTKWNVLPVFNSVISDLGGSPLAKVTEDISVDGFADQHSSGIYILLTGKKSGGRSHLVAIRDGKIWDSWNSKNYKVTSYWKIDSTNRRAVDERTTSYMQDVGTDFAVPTVEDTIIKYAVKKDMNFQEFHINLTASKYQIVVNCSIELRADNLLSKKRYYRFNITLVIEPTWTETEIVDFVQKTAKQKAYDRMWTINEQEKNLREAAEVEKQLGDSNNSKCLFMTEQEERFVKTLPGWVRPLIKYIDIQRPGQYPDSYQLKISKLPSDTAHPDFRYFQFEGQNANDIKEMLRRYKENNEVEGIDYNYWDEY